MSALRAQRSQMTEAVMLFDEHGIVAEMLYPEFEVVLDHFVNLPEWAGERVRAAYVTINPRLQVRGVVLFYLGFDWDGAADKDWNIPLRQLLEKADLGPDLGDGPVRFVCRSQTPSPWLEQQLWDPSLSPSFNHLSLIRDAVRRNQLRLLVEEEQGAVNFERLQMAAEDQWQLPPAEITSAGPEQSILLNDETSETERIQEQRQKAARLIREQRLRIRTLETRYDEAVALMRSESEQKLAVSQQRIDETEKALQDEQETVHLLRQQVEQLTNMSIDIRQRLRAQTEQSESLRAQHVQEMENRHNDLESNRQREQAGFERQLQEREQQLQAALAECERLRSECESRPQQPEQSLLQSLQDKGVALVTMLPGAGNITIPVSEAEGFLDNPDAYAARHCQVSTEEYVTWLKHYRQPACDAIIQVTGEPCGLPLERKTHPGRFTLGVSNRCSRHKELR